jgi:hypothetical protein
MGGCVDVLCIPCAERDGIASLDVLRRRIFIHATPAPAAIRCQRDRHNGSNDLYHRVTNGLLFWTNEVPIRTHHVAPVCHVV